MKKLTIFALLACVISLGACSKSDDNNQTTNPTNNNQPISNTSNFIVNGVNDLTMTANDTKVMPLVIEYVEGDQEVVTLTVTGLPDKVSAKFSSESGTPTFNSVLEITTNYAQGGSYPITITAATATGKTKVLSFNLKIEGQTNCRPNIIGVYRYKEDCAGQTQTAGWEIKEHPDDENSIYLPGDNTYITSLKGVLNCSKGTLTIPTYTKTYSDQDGITTYEYSGSGTFEAPNKITYQLTTVITYPGVAPLTNTCTYTFTK